MTGFKRTRRPKPKSPNLQPTAKEPIPVIYQEMLADAVSSPPSRFNEENKPLKRRRVGGRIVSRHDGDTSGYDTGHSTAPAEDTDTDRATVEKASTGRQTAYNDSDDSVDSDMDWEEVEIVRDRVGGDTGEDMKAEEPMHLVIDTTSTGIQKRRPSQRRPVSAIDKKMRLDVHKTHLLCLLAHVRLRNYWCDDAQVQVNIWIL